MHARLDGADRDAEGRRHPVVGQALDRAQLDDVAQAAGERREGRREVDRSPQATMPSAPAGASAESSRGVVPTRFDQRVPERRQSRKARRPRVKRNAVKGWSRPSGVAVR